MLWLAKASTGSQSIPLVCMGLFNVEGVGVIGRSSLLARQTTYVPIDRGQTRSSGHVQHSPNIDNVNTKTGTVHLLLKDVRSLPCCRQRNRVPTRNCWSYSFEGWVNKDLGPCLLDRILNRIWHHGNILEGPVMDRATDPRRTHVYTEAFHTPYRNMGSSGIVSCCSIAIWFSIEPFHFHCSMGHHGTIMLSSVAIPCSSRSFHGAVLHFDPFRRNKVDCHPFGGSLALRDQGGLTGCRFLSSDGDM